MGKIIHPAKRPQSLEEKLSGQKAAIEYARKGEDWG
jgi:hypothetical protein